jgi:hypothetical protein
VRELSRLQEATSSNPEFVRRLFFAARVAAMQVDPRATSNNRPGNISRVELENRFEIYAVILPNNRGLPGDLNQTRMCVRDLT